MSIGVVIATYNRRSNLELALESLAQQTYTDFHTVIADDGSTDGTRALVEELGAAAHWRGRLTWVGCGVNQGMRLARARNIGAANLPADATLLVILDSDIMLERHTLERFAAAHAAHPSAVLVGRMEWLPPLERPYVQQMLRDGALDTLRRYVPQIDPVMIEGTWVGRDLRSAHLQSDPFSNGPAGIRPLRRNLIVSSNWAYPLDLFWAIGGFDEQIKGYGCEEVELGARSEQRAIECLVLPDIWGLHVWHPKGNPEVCKQELQANLNYLIQKHGYAPA
ncbi:MAG: hypothetical protein OHK0022_15010 [Roseiflexaceae bacterium]